MSFGGRSMKREELKFKTELRQMTRKSQDEYSSLPAKERAKLLEYVAESNPKKKGKKQVRPQPKENADGFSSSLDELPPPSPSVDLELRSTPGIETPYHATRVGDRGIQDSVNAGGRTEDLQSGITGRSTGTASIRAKVDLSVVMQGRGFANVDGDHSSTVLSREEQIKRKRASSSGKPKSGRRTQQSPLRSPKPDETKTKPAIIGAQTTTVPIQLAPRPSVKEAQQPNKEPGRSPSQSSAESRKSQLELTEELAGDGCDAAVIKGEFLDMNESPVQTVTNTNEERAPKTSTAGEDVETELEPEPVDPIPEEESQQNAIHSQIQALTSQLSKPEINILTLMKAVENEEGEEAGKEDIQAVLSSQRESILMKILAERNSMDFSVLGATKSVSPRDTYTPRSPARKDTMQSQGNETVGRDHRTNTFRSSMSIKETGRAAESGQGDGGRTSIDRSKVTHSSPLRTAEVPLTGSVPTRFSKRDLLSQEAASISTEKAKEVLELPVEVTAEDVISIKGHQAELACKDLVAPVNSSENLAQNLKDQRAKQLSEKLAFLGTWQDSGNQKDLKLGKPTNIHHFCTLPSRVQLLPYLSRLTREAHTRDRLPRARLQMRATPDIQGREDEAGEENLDEPDAEAEEVQEKPRQQTEQRRLALVAQRIIDEAIVAGDNEETMQKLKSAAERLFVSSEEGPLDITGDRIELKQSSSRLYWTPAPPKMSLAPETIKAKLFPEYHGAPVLQESLLTGEHRTLTLPDSDEERTTADRGESGDKDFKMRLLSRTHGSMSDLDKLPLSDAKTRPRTEPHRGGEGDTALEMTWEHESEAGSIREDAGAPTKFTSILDKRRHESKAKAGGEGASTDGDGEQNGDDAAALTDKEHPFRRAASQPHLMGDTNTLQVSADYDVSMEELNYQLSQLSSIKADLRGAEERQQQEQLGAVPSVHGSLQSQSILLEAPGQHQELEPEEPRTDTDCASAVTGTSRVTVLTGTGRLKPAKKNKKKFKKDPGRERKIREFLEQPARLLIRTTSFHCLQELEKSETRIRQHDADVVSVPRPLSTRCSSVPGLLDFDKFTEDNSVGPVIDAFDWAREQFWYKWFDEVYPPTPPPPEIRLDVHSHLSSPRPPSGSKSSTVVVNNAILDDVQVIEPEISHKNRELYAALEDEVDRLTELIDTTEKKETLAFHLCRRGAVYRKLGKLKLAWDDLNRSIQLEPQLLDAYWHRHLLNLLREDRKAALEDLTFIIKNSSKQARAFRSRAELYRLEGDPTMAIVNYSQAIKLNPNDAETYYQRAAMFKMRGDMILALEDYKMAATLLPCKTEAMHELGRYHFEHRNWNAALTDYTEVLRQDEHDAVAYTFRARTHAKTKNYAAALRDLSAAVHYGPNNAVAFYHRGCLLRKLHPRRALQDFSVSLLLDSSEDNVNAFLHRGILYTDMKRWEDAVPDFEAALSLEPNLASAHVNIGLIYITRNSNYHKAIRRFTSAIRVDPTYVRAYICRAEAHHKVHMLQEAVLDYTRVIHLKPDVADYHMARGRLLMQQNKLDLASFHVRQAAELNQGLGASATQQAVVQSFLRNFDQAIEVLERATRVKPVAPLFVLLGKTNMKAKKFLDAITSFNTAIQILTPWDPKKELPQAAALVYFLIGMCHSELGKPASALEAFNSAIKVNPEYAEAFYQRGLTKMKLVHSKGIHDFNRALAINPALFQAFLSRAAYYGMKGRYSKGIMSCNEAIKLQPHSVRAYLYRGALKYHIKAYSLAVKDLTEAVAIDCKCALAYFNRAVCYHEMRFFQKALMDYGTVMLLEEKPNLKVLQNRGILYLEIDDVENALQDFLAAAQVSMFDPKIRHTIGLCYHKLGRLVEAVAAYNDALQIDPFFVEAYNGRGNALMDFGHDTGNVLGRRDYLKALHMDPSCLSARVNLAYNLQVEGRFQAAWDQFTAAISIDRGCQAALEGRAVVNLQMQNTFGAFVDMNDALKISKTAELLTNRGVVHQFMGDYVNAVRDYQAALKTEPSFALAYYNAANVYFRQRQFQQSVTYYDKALSWDARDESAVLNRAIAKVMLKDTKGALHDFNKAVELNPYAAHVYFNRGNLYASLRKYKDAEEDYTRALSLRPGDALVYKKRADVLGKQGNRPAAIEDYKKAIIIQTRKRAA